MPVLLRACALYSVQVLERKFQDFNEEISGEIPERTTEDDDSSYGYS
jgi:hypothetical protein